MDGDNDTNTITDTDSEYYNVGCEYNDDNDFTDEEDDTNPFEGINMI